MHHTEITDKMVCAAVQEYQANRDNFPYEILAKRTGKPENLCYKAMIRAERRELIEYGVSLRTGWLTEKGIGLLG